MFNPHPYDDPSAINRPDLSPDTLASIVHGTRATAAHLAELFVRRATEVSPSALVVALDGYIGTDFSPVLNLVLQQLAIHGVATRVHDIRECYQAADTLAEALGDYLPSDREKDPVLLFGKVFHGAYEDLFATGAEDRLRLKIAAEKAAARAPTVILLHGCGCTAAPLRAVCDLVVYLDLTPKQAILRAKAGLVANLGDPHPRPFKELLRRLYYVDFEVAGRLRGDLLRRDEIDFYIARDAGGECTLLPRTALAVIFDALARRPFRCKPVYIEGVWGGSFVKRVRRLPDSMKNCAWVFDLIPLEVSVVVAAGERLLDFPYFTFVQARGEALMGAECTRAFGGYFPIRFNYDDTWHGGGNMSIQVHPPRDYCRRENDELGGQDESYYVVATGHDAKTYLGFREGVTKADFMAQARRSETEKIPFDHDCYVHAVPSLPGTQLLLPGGTIHASGRNQVVLEIGSLTMGSYTYKLYDYLRADLDGVPRPIHTYHGEKVLDPRWDAATAERELVPAPAPLRQGEGWSEQLVGEHRAIYFSLRRLEFVREIEDDTAGKFHVLALVDGEEVLVRSKVYPGLNYRAHYLDVVVVPAKLGPYVIENLGKQPVVIHKTLLKDGAYEP